MSAVRGRGVLRVTFLVQLIFHVTPYRYLPQNGIVSYTFGRSNILHRYITTANEIPYHVLVVYSNLYCSGCLVRSKIVLTVASCLIKRKTHKTFVKVGVSSVTEVGQVIPVVDVKIHEYYGYINSMDNDIAMLVLEDNVYFGAKVMKAMIVEPDTALRTGITLAVSGWGGPNLQQKYANLLLWTEFIVTEPEECISIYGRLITPSNFCAKYQPDRRLSDNGGPAVYNDVVVGLVSYAATNSVEPYVALVTNVSYFHRWIALNTQRFLGKYCLPTEDDSYSSSETEYVGMPEYIKSSYSKLSSKINSYVDANVKK